MTFLAGQFVCKDCGIINSTDEELKSHITVIHLSWIPYKCNLCTDVYLPTEKAVSNHFLRTHGQSAPNNSQLVYLFDEMKLNRLHALYYDALNSYFEQPRSVQKNPLNIKETPVAHDIISVTEEEEDQFLSETNDFSKSETYSTLLNQNTLPLPFVTEDVVATGDQRGQTPMIYVDNFATQNSQESPKLNLENRPSQKRRRVDETDEMTRQTRRSLNTPVDLTEQEPEYEMRDSFSTPHNFGDDCTSNFQHETNDAELLLLMPTRENEHVLLKAWHNPMPREQPALRIQIYSDITCVKFVGKVLTNLQLHNAAIAESVRQGAVIDDQLNRLSKKCFRTDKMEDRLRKLLARWIGYVDVIILQTTSLGKSHKLGIRFGTEDNYLTTNKKRTEGGKELIALQPEPVATALNMAWHNYFCVDSLCGDDNLAFQELHEECIIRVIKMLQSRGRHKKTKRGNKSKTDIY